MCRGFIKTIMGCGQLRDEVKDLTFHAQLLSQKNISLYEWLQTTDNELKACVLERKRLRDDVQTWRSRADDWERQYNKLQYKLTTPPAMELVDVPVLKMVEAVVEVYGVKVVDDDKVVLSSSGVYRLPTSLGDWRRFYEWTAVGVEPHGRRKYGEFHKCTNFALDFLGQANHYPRTEGLGLAYMGIMTQLGWHGINAAFTCPNGKAVLNHFDPQNGDVYPSDWVIEQGLHFLKELEGDTGQTKDRVLGRILG